MLHTNQSFAQKSKVKLFPNPATDHVQINGIEGNVKVVISDIYCRVLISKEINCDEKICIKSLSRGIYILKLIRSDGEIERKKLEKK